LSCRIKTAVKMKKRNFKFAVKLKNTCGHCQFLVCGAAYRDEHLTKSVDPLLY